MVKNKFSFFNGGNDEPKKRGFTNEGQQSAFKGNKLEFSNSLKVDSSDLLNYEKFQGYDLLSNILLHLGVPKTLATNPTVLVRVENILEEMYSKKKIKCPSISIPDKYTVDAIIKTIQSSRIIPQEERETAFKNANFFHTKPEYRNYGININSSDGSISIQRVFACDPLGDYKFGHYTIDSRRFSVDTKNPDNIIEDYSRSLAHRDNDFEEYKYEESSTMWNQYGIDVEREEKEYWYIPGDRPSDSDKRVQYHAKHRRCEENPFIIEIETITNSNFDKYNKYLKPDERELGIGSGTQHFERKGIHYYTTTPPTMGYGNICSFPDTKHKDSEIGFDIFTYFDVLKDAEDHFNKFSKDKLEEKIRIRKGSYRFEADRLYNKGLNILAEQAGISKPESEITKS